MSFETFVIRRYLKIRYQGKIVPLITILATIGVTVGVAVLMVVIAVMTGTQSELKNRILGIEAHAVIQRYHGWIADDPQLYHRIEAIPGVQSASPGIYTQGMVRSSTGVSGIVLRGVASGARGLRVGNLSGGQIAGLVAGDPKASGQFHLVIGTVLADKLKVNVGDDVMVMVAGNRGIGTGQLPEMHRLKVAGLFDTGMHQYDGKMGYISVDGMQQILGLTASVTGIEIRVTDPDAVKDVGRAIVGALGDQYWIYDWQSMNRNLFAMLSMQKLVMYIILTLIIIVAAFNIASALIMMVKAKTKDIAIMKAMGASSASLQRIFLGKGLIIGAIGIVLGVGCGAIICWLLSQYQFIHLPGDIYFLTTLPVKVNVADIAIIVLGTLLICFCASLYPARKAFKMEAVTGIRYG
jgi:lipoprotein-releasing system permease protein